MKKKENKMNELRIKIDNLAKSITKKTEVINKVIENFNEYYNVANNIINSFEKKNIHFYILDNINNIIEYNKKIIKDIDIILNEKNIENKNKYLSEIHKKMFINNEFLLVYKLGKVGILRIFGKPFVEKNKNNFNMIINGENYKLSSTIKIIDIETGNSSNKIIEYPKDKDEENNIEIINDGPEIRIKIEEYLELRLIQRKTVKDISYMFGGCSTLEYIAYNFNWDVDNIVNMESLFNKCESITSFPDISNWNTKNVQNMSNIFSGCRYLYHLPDISKWNTKNVVDMSYMFCKCSSLVELPDINNWDISNVRNVDSMLYGCSSLKSKPDFSDWKKNSQIDIETMFKKIKQKKEEE
jgi:surface protein